MFALTGALLSATGLVAATESGAGGETEASGPLVALSEQGRGGGGRHSDGREGNAMFQLDGTYYTAASDLHGWNTSPRRAGGTTPAAV
ncbi:hypothetical protein GCM10009802_30080 [Streptomyces synnematoformans]|uniref:Uncharacterized protein n=1 Tax=Streptomyces synnematoformans TaxID=415721 RepID=A0ABN2YBM2_9ACTN